MGLKYKYSYLEYQNEKFIMKLGDQYELYGRGMSFYTLQNQNIDYDNSVKGISFKYFMRENKFKAKQLQKKS